MEAADKRLAALESQVEELSNDLRVLRSLLDQDHASALNKIRYVTEKILHDLCRANDISWGKGEPTLENMMGPLRAKGIVPKHMAVHLRTVQTNASPGSHYQEDPLGSTHVQVAQLALLEVLEWHYRDASPTTPAPLPPARAEPTKRRSPVPLMLGALVAVVAGVGAYLLLAGGDPTPAATEPSTPPPTAAAPPLTEPKLALQAMATYRAPRGSAISDLNSAAWWSAIERDFAAAAEQEGAPVRWSAGVELARGFIAVLNGDRPESVVHYRRATELDPTWAEAQAALAAALATSGEIDNALAAAQEAQRLAPDWVGAIAATARVFAHANKPDEAIQEYRRALNKAPDDPILLSELALVYHAARIDSQAVSYAERALAADPDMPSAHLLLAEQALEKRDQKAALAHAETAVAIMPRSLPARLALADALLLANRMDDARAAYQKVTELRKAKNIDLSARMANRYDAVARALAEDRLRDLKKRSGRSINQKRVNKRGDRRPVRSIKCDPNDPLCGI